MTFLSDDSGVDIDAKLVQIRGELEALDDVGTDRLIERLRTESAGHPALLVHSIAMGLTGMLVLGSLATLAAPLIHEAFLKQLADIDAMIGLPTPFVLLTLAFCTGTMAAMSWQVAVIRAGSSPLLPDEAKLRQKLTHDLVRLETKRDVQGRIRGAPRNPMVG